MKKNYIQPIIEAQMLQSIHVICGSVRGEIVTNPEAGDPNTMEIF